jgi:periplasmic protein TonB
MIAYQDPSMFSGRRGAAFAAVAVLHLVAGSAFYLGLAQPIIQHFTPPVTIDNIPKPRDKVEVQPPEPKLNPLKLQYDQPEDPGVPADQAISVAVQPKPAGPPVMIEPTPPAHETVAAMAARMDPKHPLHIGADYYPPSAIRGGQEGRCVVQVAVAANGQITYSSLQASSGFPLLDEACLSAVRGQRLLPATRDGKPIQSDVSLPIVWKLTGTH